MTLVTPRSRAPYIVDPDDPRAPPTELWSRMRPEERVRVVRALPSDFRSDLLHPPEGDRHFNLKAATKDTLSRHFQYVGQRVYVAGELPIYYPGERVFSPDLIAVGDVDVHERDRWVTDLEGRGIGFALEIHVHGDHRKNMEKNVARYARLGIPEYFVFDRARGDLHGFRLPVPTARVYERIPTRHGLLASAVLDVDLTILESKLRFLIADAAIPDVDELLARRGAAIDAVQAGKDKAERRAAELEKKLAEERRGRKEERQRREEEQKLREEAEKQLAELQAELQRLKGAR